MLCVRVFQGIKLCVFRFLSLVYINLKFKLLLLLRSTIPPRLIVEQEKMHTADEVEAMKKKWTEDVQKTVPDDVSSTGSLQC